MENAIAPALEKNERKLVMVTQDKSIFQAQDGKRIIWQERSKKELRPNGEGASIMVSAFLCPCYDRLCLPDDQAAGHHIIFYPKFHPEI